MTNLVRQKAAAPPWKIEGFSLNSDSGAIFMIIVALLSNLINLN